MLKRLWFLSLIFLVGCSESETKMEFFNKTALSNTEKAFAKTMADRNFDEFGSFIAEDAVFLNGGKPLRGKDEILNHWKSFFKEEAAPFSWNPEQSEIGGGNLGTTEGPVLDPTGKIIARFNSTWQLQADGKWLIIFDNGSDVCK
ncbi:MAG: nuclear transport factor 2 family protein [Bacteroidetes bacterium]|nr:nuclear transport factor 2 family protein [Bacteroidota bacterium]